MSKVSIKDFKTVKFTFGMIHFSGGHVRTPIPLTSKAVSNPGSNNDITFVKMSAREQWLIMATTSQKQYSAGMYGRQSLLDILHDKVHKHCDGEVLCDGEASSSSPKASDEHDPMMEVQQDQVDSGCSSKIKGPGQKRMRYYHNLARDSIATFDMPVRCPEEDPHCTDVRQIRLYVVDRSVVWLHMNHLEWATRYLYTQNLLKGVALVPDDSPGLGGVVA